MEGMEVEVMEVVVRFEGWVDDDVLYRIWGIL